MFSLTAVGGFCRTAGFFRSAQFLNTDHRLLVATLRLQLKSRRKALSMPRLDVSRLQDEVVVNDFACELGGRLGDCLLVGAQGRC